MFDEIHAFDADPHNFAQFQAQLFLNRLSYDIHSMNVAVSDRRGTLKAERSVDHAGGNRGGAMILGEVDAGVAGQTIQSVCIDDLFPATSGASIVMKIDVEAHEENVINGMRGLLTNNKCLVQCEVFPHLLEKIDALMTSLGYTSFERVVYDSYYRKN